MQTVEFQVSWGTDNSLNVIADVRPSRPAHMGACVLPEDSYPEEPAEVEITLCEIVDEGNPQNSGVTFDPIGLGIWNRISQKYHPLEDWINDTAIEKAEEEADEESH